LETFARFGARLDEHTRKIISHGQRIRACLKQPEFAPVSVPAQITVLLALLAGLLDSIPLDKMQEAERALQNGADTIPEEVRRRFFSADKLTDKDRDAVLQVAGEALAPFLTGSEPEP
jgi:F-type H+-transporting ATPase subunit alpha